MTNLSDDDVLIPSNFVFVRRSAHLTPPRVPALSYDPSDPVAQAIHDRQQKMRIEEDERQRRKARERIYRQAELRRVSLVKMTEKWGRLEGLPMGELRRIEEWLRKETT